MAKYLHLISEAVHRGRERSRSARTMQELLYRFVHIFEREKSLKDTKLRSLGDAKKEYKARLEDFGYDNATNPNFIKFSIDTSASLKEVAWNFINAPVSSNLSYKDKVGDAIADKLIQMWIIPIAPPGRASDDAVPILVNKTGESEFELILPKM